METPLQGHDHLLSDDITLNDMNKNDRMKQITFRFENFRRFSNNSQSRAYRMIFNEKFGLWQNRKKQNFQFHVQTFIYFWISFKQSISGSALDICKLS